MAKKSAAGSGTIRKKTVTRGGKQYTFWEARYTAGTDPGTGKQIQKSISGKTQKEVSQKLKAATAAIDAGTYLAPNKMTTGEWLDIWAEDYLGGLKPRSKDSYKSVIKTYLKPNLGAIRMEALKGYTIQGMYNRLMDGEGGKAGLSAKSIKNVHGVLHKALQQAVKNGIIPANPADACELPRVEKADLHPLDEAQISAFLTAAKGEKHEYIYQVTLFTGMREGEVLGLPWDCVDFDAGTITIKQQLQKGRGEMKGYYIATTKNGKSRTITPAPFVMNVLKRVKAVQNSRKLQAGSAWDNPWNLVFTNEVGRYLTPLEVYRHFKNIVTSIGCPDVRFHDLRHSYAMASIRAGDNIKTIQENLGHSSINMTMDIYAFVTDQMKTESASRMENFIQSVVG